VQYHPSPLNCFTAFQTVIRIECRDTSQHSST